MPQDWTFVGALADALHRSMPEDPDWDVECGQWRVDCQAIADALRENLTAWSDSFDRDRFLDRCYGRGQTTDEPPVDVEDTPPGR